MVNVHTPPSNNSPDAIRKRVTPTLTSTNILNSPVMMTGDGGASAARTTDSSVYFSVNESEIEHKTGRYRGSTDPK